MLMPYSGKWASSLPSKRTYLPASSLCHQSASRVLTTNHPGVSG